MYSLRDVISSISQQFHDALSRCEHCGKEGEVYDCDECRANKERFASDIIDLLNLVEPDVDARFRLATLAIDPLASDDQLSLTGKILKATVMHGKVDYESGGKRAD